MGCDIVVENYTTTFPCDCSPTQRGPIEMAHVQGDEVDFKLSSERANHEAEMIGSDLCDNTEHALQPFRPKISVGLFVGQERIHMAMVSLTIEKA